MYSNSATDCRSVSQKCYGTRADLEKCTFTWSVENFSFCGVKAQDEMRSANFSGDKAMKCSWYLKLFPRGEDAKKDEVTCHLFLDNAPATKTDIVAMGVAFVRTSEDMTIDKIEFDRCWAVNSGWNFFQLERGKVLKSLKDDILKVHVEITACLNTVSAFNEVVISEEHEPALRLAKDFATIFSNPKHGDIVIEVEGREIRAHQDILAARSKVFAAMFEHDTSEKAGRKVEIPDFDFNTVSALVRFIYTGMAPEKFETPLAMSLLKAADKYALEDLKNICGDYLISCLNATTVEGIFVLSDMHNVERLREKSVDFIFTNKARFDFQQHTCVVDDEERVYVILRKK